MATIVVKLMRPRSPSDVPHAPAETPPLRTRALTLAAVAASTGGVALVLLSLAGGPVWLRIALIAVGGVVGVVGLAELAAATLVEVRSGTHHS